MTEKELFEAAVRIANRIHEIVGGDKLVRMEDRRSESVNPFYNQTEQGLFLEFYYGMPSSLWTPWGKWGFGGSGMGHFGHIEAKVAEEFDATLHMPLQTTRMGEFGPVYALHRVGNVQLPEPKEREHDSYLSYDDAKEAWKGLGGNW